MADKKISQMNVLSALTSGAAFEVSLSGQTYQVTIDVILEFVQAAIAQYGLDLTGAAALGFNMFAVTDAPSDWDPGDPGWGGDPVDLTYLNGLWLTLGLDYDDTYKTITHKEATKNTAALAMHFASDHFAGESYRAIALIVVQGTQARIDANNIIGGGLPDRLIYPAFGAIGGYEMIKVFADNKTMAAATSRDEIDGDGAQHGFDVRVHQKQSDDGSEEIWMGGARAVNDNDGTSNFPDHPSFRFGFRQVIDTTGSVDQTTLVEFVIQYADATAGELVYSDCLAFPLGIGLKLPADQIGYDNATSGMTADEVQAALDELDARVTALEP
jgi:hypothetical protein